MRVTTLKSVVLPAPLGPIRPTMQPCGTSKLTPSRATRPPKRTLTPLTESRGASAAATGVDPLAAGAVLMPGPALEAGSGAVAGGPPSAAFADSNLGERPKQVVRR